MLSISLPLIRSGRSCIKIFVLFLKQVHVTATILNMLSSSAYLKDLFLFCSDWPICLWKLELKQSINILRFDPNENDTCLKLVSALFKKKIIKIKAHVQKLGMDIHLKKHIQMSITSFDGRRLKISLINSRILHRVG